MHAKKRAKTPYMKAAAMPSQRSTMMPAARKRPKKPPMMSSLPAGKGLLER